MTQPKGTVPRKEFFRLVRKDIKRALKGSKKPFKKLVTPRMKIDILGLALAALTMGVKVSLAWVVLIRSVPARAIQVWVLPRFSR